MHKLMRYDLPEETLARVLRTVERGRRAYRHYLEILKAQRSAMTQGRWAQLPILQARIPEVEAAVAEMIRTVKPVRTRIETEGLSGPNVTRFEAGTAGAARDAALVSYHLSSLTAHATRVRDRTGADLGRTVQPAGHTRPTPGHRAYGLSRGTERVLDRQG